MKIVIMGAGGTGGYFGGHLARAGFDVTFIARGRQLQALRERGLFVQGPDAEFSIQPVQATDDPSTVGTVDVVLFCVKAYDAIYAAELIRPMIGARTVVIPILNGVDHIEELKTIVGAEHVLGGAARVSAHIVEPGVVRWLWAAEFIFGELSGGTTMRCIEIQKAWAVSGVPVQVVPDITARMWQKYGLICGIAGVCCIVRGSSGVVMSHARTKDLLRQTIAETIAVGRAKQVALSPTVVDSVMHFLVNQPPQTRPSMLLDLERGQRLELEALNGTVSRYGKMFGVPTPVNDVITAALLPYVDGGK